MLLCVGERLYARPERLHVNDHPPISEAELIKKRDIFDPLERKSPEQLMSKITFEGPDSEL
jgi:hypothetical protein